MPPSICSLIILPLLDLKINKKTPASTETGEIFIFKKTYFEASSIATAHATVIPTMGLLPAPIRPIIST